MTPFLQLLLALTIVIAAAKGGGWLSQKIHQPAVLGELLAGLLLGPSLINFLHTPAFSDPHLEETLLHLAELGVISLMFIAGLEIELDEMVHAGRVSALAGVLGVAVPLVFGTLAAAPFGYDSTAAIFIGIILTATSVSISAQTLIELKVLRSREGIALLGAAVIDDVLVILILSIFTALAGGAGGLSDILIVLLKMIAYLVVAGLIGTLLLPRLANWVHRQPISEGLIALVLVAAMFFAWSAEEFGGLAAITGAFIAGVGLARSPLREEIERGMHAITYAFLVPIFFVSIGLQADARQISSDALPFAVIIVLVAIATKIVGAGLGARAGGFTMPESLRVGVGMISRGEVGLIVAGVGIQNNLIAADTFAIVVIIVLITTLITPLLLRWAFSQKPKEVSRA
jgi:Kef-type K+ transport system membrane component KefB